MRYGGHTTRRQFALGKLVSGQHTQTKHCTPTVSTISQKRYLLQWKGLNGRIYCEV